MCVLNRKSENFPPVSSLMFIFNYVRYYLFKKIDKFKEFSVDTLFSQPSGKGTDTLGPGARLVMGKCARD